MYPRTSLVLALLAVVLGGLVWVQTRYPLVHREPIEAVRSALAEQDDEASWAAITRNAPPPLSDLTETVDCPLFSATRRVVAAPVAQTLVPDAPPPVLVPPPTLSFTAVVINGEDRVAVVSQSGSGVFERLREGDQVQGWRVDRVDPDRLRLMLGESVHEVELRSYESSPAPVAPPLRQSATSRQVPAADGSRPRRPARGPRKRSRERSQKQ